MNEDSIFYLQEFVLKNLIFYIMGLEKIKSGILIIIKLLFNNFASVNWFIIFIYLNEINAVFKIP